MIPVDDADLNTTRTFEMVEDIRKYCVGPRILVILAVHLDTLRNCLEQENVKRYEYLLSDQIKIPHLQESKCREMAERYIDKLIPGNRQIHLPYIDEWFRAERTDVNLYYKLPVRCFSDKENPRDFRRCRDLLQYGDFPQYRDLLDYGENSSHNYQHRLFRLVYEKTGIILMPPRDYLHNFLPRRFREITHFLSYFCEMEDIDVSGKGSIQRLLEFYYGKESPNDKEQQESPALLAARKENLERMMVYFLQHWCPVMLDKEQIWIIQEIHKVPLKLKCKKTIDLLREYCDKLALRSIDSHVGSYINGEVHFPDEGDVGSYADVMDVLDQMKEKLNVEFKFEFIYAIRLYYSICMNQSLCVHLERGDGFSEISAMCREKIFPESAFYKNKADIRLSLIHIYILSRCGAHEANRKKDSCVS